MLEPLVEAEDPWRLLVPAACAQHGVALKPHPINPVAFIRGKEAQPRRDAFVASHPAC
jgi:hypothetical protein